MNIDDDITDSTTKLDESWRSLSARSLASETLSRQSVESPSVSSRGSRKAFDKHYKMVRTMRHRHVSLIGKSQTSVDTESSNTNKRATEVNVAAVDVTEVETDEEDAMIHVAHANPTAFSLFQSQSQRSLLSAKSDHLSQDFRSIPNSRGARRYTSELAKTTHPAQGHTATTANSSPLFLTKNRLSIQRYASQSQLFGMVPPRVNGPQKQSSKESAAPIRPSVRDSPVAKPISEQYADVTIGCDRRSPRRAVSEVGRSSLFQPGYTRQRSSRRVSTPRLCPSVSKQVAPHSALQKPKAVAQSYSSHEKLNQLLKEYDMLMNDSSNEATLTGW